MFKKIGIIVTVMYILRVISQATVLTMARQSEDTDVRDDLEIYDSAMTTEAEARAWKRLHLVQLSHSLRKTL